MAEPSLRLRLRRARRRLSFLALRWLLRCAGFARARRLGSLFAELQFWLDRGNRLRQQQDMAAVLGRAPDDPQVAAQLRQAYRINSGAVFEIMAMMDRRQNAGMLAAHCRIEGLEELQAALAHGRGAILLAAHMGNAALLAIRLADSGWPVSVVYREARMMSAGFFQDGLARYGVQGILANTGLRAYGQMLGALREGRIVFVMMDQGVKKAEDGIVQRFLGKDMPMPAGPVQLARHARAPVLPVETLAADPVWRFAIRPPVALAGSGPLEADLARLLQLTERQVRERPQLWSWHHRRWRKYPLAGSD
ncbi:MAG: lysophospholipid acyltransferase family protein [Pseudomonadota bacterium]